MRRQRRPTASRVLFSSFSPPPAPSLAALARARRPCGAAMATVRVRASASTSAATRTRTRTRARARFLARPRAAPPTSPRPPTRSSPRPRLTPRRLPTPPPGWSPETITVFDRTFVKGASSGAAARLVRGAGSDAAASDLVKGRYEGGFKLWECAEGPRRVPPPRGPGRHEPPTRRARPRTRMRTRPSGPRRRRVRRARGHPRRLQPRGARRAHRAERPSKRERGPLRPAPHILSIPRGRLGIPRRVQSVGTGIRGRRVGGGDGVRRE